MFKIIDSLGEQDKTKNQNRKYFILCTKCNKKIIIKQIGIRFVIENNNDNDIHTQAALEWIREKSLSRSEFRRYKILKKYGDLE